MEIALFSNVKKLYDNELYSCVIPAVSTYISCKYFHFQNNPPVQASLLSTLLLNDRMLATPEMEYQVLLFQGNSYYNERRFRLAFKYLDSALLMRKAMIRYKNIHLAAIENTYDHFTDIETRYRLAICYRELGEPNMAISTLQSIPSKSRTPKINMLLGKLLHHSPSSNTSEATVAYKDVLSECPMALDAITSLLEIGADGIEVNSLVVNGECP